MMTPSPARIPSFRDLLLRLAAVLGMVAAFVTMMLVLEFLFAL